MSKEVPIISAEGLVHHYGGVLALNGLSLSINSGDFVAILGSNGAGKSTLAMIIGGMLPPSEGKVFISGKPIRNRRAMIRKGVAIVPEGRRLFGQLSIQENLMLGGFGAGISQAESRRRMSRAVELIPEPLRNRLDRAAATLSGGEQQMLAIARATVSNPNLLIIDEPSMGLAPVLVKRVYEVLDALHKTGVTIVLIEQLATEALRRASDILVLDRGHLAYSGTSKTDAETALFADLSSAKGPGS